MRMLRRLVYPLAGCGAVSAIAYYVLITPASDTAGDQFAALGAIGLLMALPLAFVTLFAAGVIMEYRFNVRDPVTFAFVGIGLMIAAAVILVGGGLLIGAHGSTMLQYVLGAAIASAVASVPTYLLWAFFERRAPNNALLTDVSTSPLRAQHDAAKRGR